MNTNLQPLYVSFFQNWLRDSAADPAKERLGHHGSRRIFHGDRRQERGRLATLVGRHGLQHAEELGDVHEGVGGLLQQPEPGLAEAERDQPGVLIHQAGALRHRAQGCEADRLDRQRLAQKPQGDAERGKGQKFEKAHTNKKKEKVTQIGWDKAESHFQSESGFFWVIIVLVVIMGSFFVVL